MTATAMDRSPAPLLAYDAKPDPISALLMLLGAAGAGLGLAFVFYALLVDGHAAFNTSSDMAWGSPIAFYLFFLLTSSGLSIVASLDTVFGLRVFHPVAKRCVWMSIVALVAGFSVLALEIGRPFRMLWALPVGMQFHSPMWWMGVFYSLDLALLCAKFWLMHTRRWHAPGTHGLSVLSFVISILAPGTLGLVFGMMAMRPAWYSPIMPMYFILTGFVGALAFVLFFTAVLPNQRRKPNEALFDVLLPRLFFVSLLAVIGMRFGQIVTTLWSNYEGMEAHWLSLDSALFKIEILVGLALPALLTATNGMRANRALVMLAGFAYLIGNFFGRLELLINGQKVPLFKGYWAGYVDYWPSLTEWMLVPAGIGIYLFLYGAGEWLLRLAEAEPRQGRTS
ncbi:MAG: polysulfide reductase [Alphaproteobacteria bacterium]|nr:polysulfide reductase [Alphaproteobacteria bacterium]